MTIGSAELHMPEWLRQRTLISPNRLALVFREERWTFADLDRRVSGTVSRLRAAGVRPHDRLALLAGNGPGFVQMVHAAPRLGAVLVPLNTRLTGSELMWQMKDSEPSLLVYDETQREKVADIAAASPYPRHFSLAEVSAEAVSAPATEPDPTAELVDLRAVHTIVYTSGTSGTPKGTMLTFGNHWWSAVGSALNLGLNPSDRWLACLPLFHVGGLAILMRSLIYGMPVVLQDRFDPEEVNRAIDEDAVTIVSVVATMLHRMLEERGDRPYPPNLRCILVGGGPVPRDLLEECARRAVPVVQTYGLTEACSQVTTLAPEDALRKLGAAGKPLFPMEVRIEGEDARILPPGEEGQSVVRGPTVTAGYFRRPRETQEALRGGWLHTGDIGYLDDQGYVYVLDRRDDLIVSGGENVYPAEVEEALRSHPDVLDAGVIGLPDEVWGQRVVAAVTLREGTRVGEDELVAFCRSHLAPYKAPGEIRPVDELPRTATGKLLRRGLQEWWT